MEFKSLKNIETSFRQIRLFGIVVVSLCAIVAISAVCVSLRFAEKQREKIYVLDNGKSLMLALSQDMNQNRPAEPANTYADSMNCSSLFHRTSQQSSTTSTVR